ncbi:MAG: flagellar motor switch protein FliG [Actinomycetota bacterium]|nr:flagellar motor switch protein FliG [Actinomycetota bacterium]
MQSLSSKTNVGLKKAAIFLITVGSEIASKVLACLEDSEVEELTMEIANYKDIPIDQKESVLKEFYENFVAIDSFDTGGLNYAQEVLEKAYGKEKSQKMSERLLRNLSNGPFRFLKDVEPEILVNLIKNEHPQTIAMVHTYLPPDLAAKVLCSLSPELQADVGVRIAKTERTSPEFIKMVEKLLEDKIKNISKQKTSTISGVETIVNILNQVDRSSEKAILTSLEEKDKDLADEVRLLLFVFEDILKLDDKAVQRLLKEVDTQILVKALKGTSKEVKDKIFNNMSERASLIIKEDMEAIGPLRLVDVEVAQQAVVKIIKDLEDSGEIIINRGNEAVVI